MLVHRLLNICLLRCQTPVGPRRVCLKRRNLIRLTGTNINVVSDGYELSACGRGWMRAGDRTASSVEARKDGLTQFVLLGMARSRPTEERSDESRQLSTVGSSREWYTCVWEVKGRTQKCESFDFFLASMRNCHWN